METITLKAPLRTYHKRFNRFLWLLIAVKGLKPRNHHLWRIMDGVAFQDTETALETALYNEGVEISPKMAERLPKVVAEDDRRRTRRPRNKVANQT